MKWYRIRRKLKALGAFLSILILLPYVVSVFVNGTGTGKERKQDTSWIRVSTVDRYGKETAEEVEWTDFLVGILAKEMPETYEPEALKAQAVLIRTVLYQELENAEGGAVSETYMSRAEMEKTWSISDYAIYYEKYRKAVTETDDMVLRYNDTYAWVPYHQSSNGYTRSAEEVMGDTDFPYLTVKECPADRDAEEEVQVFSYEYGRIQELCREFLVAEAKEKAETGYTFSDFEILSLDSAGYVKELRIGSTVCTGDQFRDALSLPSGAFTLTDDGSRLKITTSGKGHGLGMSQWTANEMAKEGKNCEEILQYFFEGTTVSMEIQETTLLGQVQE